MNGRARESLADIDYEMMPFISQEVCKLCNGKLLLGLKVICKLRSSSTFRLLLRIYHRSPSPQGTLVPEQVATVFANLRKTSW
jgi:hypothetical protein